MLRHLNCVLVTLSVTGMLLPTLATASTVSPQAAKQVIRDVQLHDGGVLVGQMLDAQGKGIASAPVVLIAMGKEVARTETNQQGNFHFAGLKGGVYQVATVGQQHAYRAWAPKTAPPAAQRGVMLVSDTEVIRGQCGCGTPVCGSAVCSNGCGCGAYGRGAGGGGIGGWMANHPILTAGAVATAIAVPLAVDDDDDPPATP